MAVVGSCTGAPNFQHKHLTVDNHGIAFKSDRKYLQVYFDSTRSVVMLKHVNHFGHLAYQENKLCPLSCDGEKAIAQLSEMLFHL